ncbi:MAG: ankyrin repeat domain-containing protein, partial [Gammaproteobacteria bacterium]|nr:ankyrin repeat domain-containing protein [Gammaproteobacteria bacterium]
IPYMLTRAHHFPLPLIATATRILFSSRTFSSKSSLLFIPHAFSHDEAIKKITETEQRRLFAPLNPYAQKSAVSILESPLKKVLLPFFGMQAEITSTQYEGEYGTKHTYVTYTDKGSPIVHTYISWHPIKGTLGSCEYTPEERDMLIYAGYTWSANTIEHALQCHPILSKLKSFDLNKIPSDTYIDSFLKRSANAQSAGHARIKQNETERAKEDIKLQTGSPYTKVNRLNMQLKNFRSSSFMLPAYVLQYQNCPPRVLSAITKDDHEILGKAPISPEKSALAAALVSTLATIVFFEAALPARIAMIIGSSLFGAAWARYRLAISAYLQENQLNKDKKYNESIHATEADQERFKCTQRDFSFFNKESVASQLLTIEPKNYSIMGLDPDQPISEKIVYAAFARKIQIVHPDHQNGSAEKTRELIKAREQFIDALKRHTQNHSSHPSGKRFFSSRPTYIQEPPRSVYHPHAAKLIREMLVIKNYSAALRMVKEEEVHPDAHDQGENTLLAEAAKQGDCHAIRFAIDELHASPDTSCDCPAHKTPLHYAVENGHRTAAKLLLEKSANPNLINSYGETPLDIAYQKHDDKTINLLQQWGAIRGEKGLLVTLRRYTFGYGSDERTRLLNQPKEDSVIQLPAKTRTK